MNQSSRGKSPASASCRHTVRDSRKRKNSRWNTGFDGYLEAGFAKSLARDAVLGTKRYSGRSSGCGIVVKKERESGTPVLLQAVRMKTEVYTERAECNTSSVLLIHRCCSIEQRFDDTEKTE